MTRDSVTPTPPALAGLGWRSLAAADLPAIAALAADCLAVDGGLPLAASEAVFRPRYLPDDPHATIGALDRGGRLVAGAAVRLTLTQDERHAIVVGQVHPAYRRRGLGTFMLDWSMAQARALLASGPADRPGVMVIQTEMLTEESARLYARAGFAQQVAEDVMRRDLLAPIPDASLPADVALTQWSASTAAQFFEVYQAAFRERPGFPGWSAEEWIAWVADDDQFRPGLSLLARVGARPVGFIVCSDDWVVQVGVRPEWRGRGLAAALVVEALRRMRAAGGRQALLDVNVNNPSAARVYMRLGFATIGRRARYVLA